MINSTIKLNFRAPEKGGIKPDPVTYNVTLPTSTELTNYPQELVAKFLNASILAAVKDYVRLCHDEAKAITDDIFGQLLAEPEVTRTRGISDEIRTAAAISFKEWLEAAGKSANTVAHVSKSFASGFKERYSPDYAKPLQVAVQKWFMSLDEADQEVFEGLAAKLNEKLQSYIDVGLDISDL